MKKVLIAVVIISILAGVGFWLFGDKLISKREDSKPISLKMWGLWEDERAIKPAIDEYHRLHSNITIEYNHQNSPNYRTRVQTQISESSGPDIIMVHNSWLPMFLKNNSLAEIPGDIISSDEFKKIFYPVTFDSFSSNNKIYALPLEVDGLALFYNEEILQKAEISPPRTWKEFTDAAVRLTVRDSTGNITQAGAAMGSPANVDHWPDIIGLLFYQQPGADLNNPASSAGAEVIRFFTNFITDPSKKVWSQNMESSTEAFYLGKLAFYIAPSWRAHDLREANPQIKFKTIPVPQLSDKSPQVGWASFWGFAVSAKSEKQKAAFEFLKYLTSKETQKMLYQEASKIRFFGQPYSRIDLRQEIIDEPVAGSFVKQAPNYKWWYLSSRTFDQGINDETITYFENAINATLQGGDPLAALGTTQKGVKQVMEKYLPQTPQK